MKEVYVNIKDFGKATRETFEKIGFNKDLITIEELVVAIEDLQCNVETLKEEMEDYKQYVQDNYKQRSPYDLYGISERDFH